MVRTQFSMPNEEYLAAKREVQGLGMIESGAAEASQKIDELVDGHKD